MTNSHIMDFDDFDVDAYLQLPLDVPIVPTAPVAPMVPIASMAPMVAVPPVALTAPATFILTDLSYDDLYQGQFSDYYEATATGFAELDWLPPDIIEPTGLDLSSAAAVDSFFRATTNDPTEQYLSSIDSAHGYRDWLNDEANDPHTSDDIPSLPSLYWSPQAQDGNSPETKEDSLETKEDNSSESCAIAALRRYALIVLRYVYQRNKLTLW